MKAYLLLFSLFYGQWLYAQVAQTTAASFLGNWCHNATGRQLHIELDEENPRLVLIFDHTLDPRGKQLGSTDSYRALIKGDKLIMHASKSPRAPYCEISMLDGKLEYRCNNILDLESEMLTSDNVDQWIFSRCKK